MTSLTESRACLASASVAAVSSLSPSVMSTQMCGTPRRAYADENMPMYMRRIASNVYVPIEQRQEDAVLGHDITTNLSNQCSLNN